MSSTCSHRRPENPPSNQKSTCWRLSAPSTCIAEMTAPKNAPIATPARSNCSTTTSPRCHPSRYTIAVTATAPTKANTVVALRPPAANVTPKTIALVAPNAAPAETPMMYGSAMGLRSKPWKTVPEVARAAPTKVAKTTRGNRSWSTMLDAMGLTDPDPSPKGAPSAPRTCETGNDTGPTATPTIATSRTATASPLRSMMDPGGGSTCAAG